MIEDMDEMKKLRKSLGMTQKELAKNAQVSQSLIAKIESGRIDPAYSKFKSIMSVLTSFSKIEQKHAKDLMVARIIRLSSSDSIKKAIQKMKQHNISQMPVFEDKQVVGLVSENVILDALTREISSNTPVEKIMREAPPTISPEAEQSLILQLLKHYPLIVVSEKGKARGIITKADIFESIYK